MEISTIKKRIIIAGVFISLFGIIGFILYYIFTPIPTCSDGKKNQTEKGVDCGGVCAPCKENKQAENIIIKELSVVSGGNNTFDVVAKISNPNDTLGTSFFEYTFLLKDENGNIIETRKGNNFILPADTKYLIELEFKIENKIIFSNVDLVIDEIKWEELNNIGKPQIGVYNKSFEKIKTGIGNQVKGIIRNESGYDLDKIFIVVILRNEKGEIIGVNKTEKNTVRTKEERDFLLTWPYQLISPIQNIEVDVQSNIFN